MYSFPKLNTILLFALSALGAHSQTQEVRTLARTGPEKSCINVLFLGDGFILSEKEAFFTVAAKQLKVLVEDDAMKCVASFVNCSAIFTASNESGISNPEKGINKDTFYSVAIVPGSRAMIVRDRGLFRLPEVLQLAPSYDFIVMLSNTPLYGGSGGGIAVVSLNQLSSAIMLHEIGHTFAGLGDEYVDSWAAVGQSYFEYPNTTRHTDIASIPWNNFIPNGAKLPSTGTPTDVNIVGLWEGAVYVAKGVYRPTYGSKMGDLTTPWGPVNLRAFQSSFLRVTARSTTSLSTFNTATTTGSTSTTLSAWMTAGAGPVFYQWSTGGKYIVGATSDKLVLPAGTDPSNYMVEVRNNKTSVVLEPKGDLQIVNLSVRTNLASASSLIVGFVCRGSKSVLLRAAGPALNLLMPNSVGLTYPDPSISLYDAAYNMLATNDNWSDLGLLFTSVGAFPFTTGSLDAALKVTASSNQTIVVGGNGQGTVLAELYAIDQSKTTSLANVSARNHVGFGDDVLIVGFVLNGSVGRRPVLIRGIGPQLAKFGVPNALSNPKIALFRGTTLVAENDDWDASLASTFTAVGAFPLGVTSKDAGMLVTLDRGAYSVIMSGVNGETGEGLIEVYDVN